MKQAIKQSLVLIACSLALAGVGCAAQAPLGPEAAASPLRVVLIGGDKSEAVFDNATRALAANLVKRGIPKISITRLSARPEEIRQDGVRTASADLILSKISSMHPGPGQGCLVFATSHGVQGRGMYLSTFNEVLTPAALDAALDAGCGAAPTVVIVSACYSGGFARTPMARPTRVILTAARADRPSFGCGAGLRYTYFDECLLQAMDNESAWKAVSVRVRDCVKAKETESRFPSSGPQAFFGERTADLALPTR